MDERDRFVVAAAEPVWAATRRLRNLRNHGVGTCDRRNHLTASLAAPVGRLCAECAELANDMLMVLHAVWLKAGRTPAVDDRAGLERWVHARAANVLLDVIRVHDAAAGIGARPEVLPAKVKRLLSDLDQDVLILMRHFGRSNDAGERGGVWPVRRWAARLGQSDRDISDAIRRIERAMTATAFTRRWYGEKVSRAMERRPGADEACTSGDRAAESSNDGDDGLLSSMGVVLDDAARLAAAGTTPETALMQAVDEAFPAAATLLPNSPHLAALAAEVAARARDCHVARFHPSSAGWDDDTRGRR